MGCEMRVDMTAAIGDMKTLDTKNLFRIQIVDFFASLDLRVFLEDGRGGGHREIIRVFF